MRGNAPAGLLGLLLLALVASVNALLVQQPCCSAYPHAGASFGPRLPWVAPGVAAKLSRAQGKECDGAVEGQIAMVDRGLESFVASVRACQRKGAIAVVVRNIPAAPEGENDVIVMGAIQNQADDITIPSVFVSKRAGSELDVLLAMNPDVFVELFAADDVNSIMAYLAYLMMSLETLLFGFVFLSITFCVCSRRLTRRREMLRREHACRCFRRHEPVALIVQDRGLLEPLNSSSSADGASGAEDVESKPVVAATRALPVVFADQHSQQQQQQQHVNLPINPDSEEPVFDQQEQ